MTASPDIFRDKSPAYEPSKGLGARISRRLTPYRARRTIPVNLERPLISFTFDDCPVSAISEGVSRLNLLGWKSTVYIAGSLLGKTNHHGPQIVPAEVLNLHRSGHEIGGHTYSHIDANAVTIPDYLADIDANQQLLSDLGIPETATFAYPFGQTQPELKTLLGLKFEGLRGIQPIAHRTEVDLNQIGSVPLFSGKAVKRAEKLIQSLKARPGWVTLFTHDIAARPSNWGCTPEEFETIIAAAQDSGADVMPVADAIRFLRSRS